MALFRTENENGTSVSLALWERAGVRGAEERISLTLILSRGERGCWEYLPGQPGWILIIPS